MRVSEYFGLERTQPYLDFVDIRLETDIAVFLDPSSLRLLNSQWGHECTSLIQHYFQTLLSSIQKGEQEKSISLISSLSERNEFHLGFSKGRSKGNAFGDISAEALCDELATSKAAKTGLLQDLEDTALLIDGVGKDRISDAVCNIIRGPLIKYTQNICKYYGIPLTPDIPSGPIWNSMSETWESKSFVGLPMTDHGSVILVPKHIVRHKLSYDYSQYYTHYLLPEMQQWEIQANTSLVRLLKDGTPKVTKKALREKYGSTKLSVVDQTIKHPSVLEVFKNDKSTAALPPLDHDQLADIEGSAAPNWDELAAELQSVATGKKSATDYENIVEKILSALFYPALCSPTKQHRIHEGRKIVDITYTNEANVGFFSWLAKHYPSAFIFVECKNYGKEIGNPEVDQLSGRFSPSRGKVGILVCRSINKPSALRKRCRDTAVDERGYIITLADSDLIEMLEYAKRGFESLSFPHLMKKFSKLVN